MASDAKDAAQLGSKSGTPCSRLVVSLRWAQLGQAERLSPSLFPHLSSGSMTEKDHRLSVDQPENQRENDADDERGNDRNIEPDVLPFDHDVAG